MVIKFDGDGLIVQTNGDGGDCAARSGTLVMGLRLREIFGISNDEWPVTATGYWLTVKKFLIASDYTVYRYNKFPYNDPKDVPGDQLLPIIMAANLMGDTVLASCIAKKNIKWSRFPNGDLCGPCDSMIAHQKRNFLGYAEIYAGSLLRCFKGNADLNDVGDDIRLTETLAFLVQQDNNWNAALNVYKRRRKPSVQRAWDWYFRPETNANPLNELWRPIIERYFT